MPNSFVTISETRVSYSEKNEGSSFIIFFFHGNSSSHRTWHEQFASAELSQFRLVAFDLPAHGSSDAASAITSNYALPQIAKLMSEAVRELSAGKPYLLVGESLGTNIVAEMLALGATPKGLLLAGPCIVGKDHMPDKFIIPDTCIGLCFIDDPGDDDLLSLCQLAINHLDTEKQQLFTSDFRSVKDKFRSSIGQAFADGIFNDEIALLKAKGAPVLVVFGEADQAIYSDYLDNAGLPLWRDKVIKLDGAGHWVHLDEPDLFTQLLKNFATDVFSKAGS